VKKKTVKGLLRRVSLFPTVGAGRCLKFTRLTLTFLQTTIQRTTLERGSNYAPQRMTMQCTENVQP